MIKVIKKRIKKKKKFLKIKNIKSRNCLKITKVLDEKIYIKKSNKIKNKEYYNKKRSCNN